MIDFISHIIDAERAYSTPSGVYLRVSDISGYGDLVHRSLDDLRSSAGARVDVDPDKEDPLDFALWKAAKPGEPSWASPWGPGRPGWHIECVAMSLAILGEGFDIHGGGNDLVFPHHTNERAEALAVGGTFASHWMHNAMLNVGGEKMAKSQGNYRTVDEMLAEHPLNARAFRLLVLQTHYRKTMEVTAELLASARAAVRRLDALAQRLSAHTAAGADRVDPPNAQTLAASQTAMDNDLGTPQAVAVMFDAVRRANVAFDADSGDGIAAASAAVALAAVLGVAPDTASEPDAAHDSAAESVVARREAAREAKDWATADALRAELASMGVTVEDTAAGPLWRR